MIKGIWAELVGLFVDDEFLAIAIVALVIGIGVLRYVEIIDPVIGGAGLVIGLPAILIIGVIRTLRRIH
ncbi:MAG: hypothetical protein EBV53_03215 [Proteobacteria bacterium]|nr:hypothetical protein [Pseudomonadota bacterium]